jgi:segregation and condensation protein B
MNFDPSTYGPFDSRDIQDAVEALIFASSEPISSAAILATLREADDRVDLTDKDIDQLIDAINQELLEQHRPYSIEMVAGGYSFMTRSDQHRWLRIFQHRNAARRLSQSALESLAVVAYKQPITKPELDIIRGVDSGYVIRSLLEKDLIEVAGRAETPGRPLYYRTSTTFLEHFGLNSVSELPKPREIEDILKDDDMAEHRQLMLELKAELERQQNTANTSDS